MSHTLTKDDIIVYVLFKALTKSVALASESPPTEEEMVESVNGLIGLAIVESGLPEPMTILERIEIGNRLEVAMDHLNIQGPHVLRLIRGGKDKKR